MSSDPQGATTAGPEWPQPQSLKTLPPKLDLAAVIPSSLDCLKDYIISVANCLQVDPGLVWPQVLSAGSLAASKGFAYQARIGHEEAAPIWTATSAPPSAKKTAVLRVLTGSLSSLHWDEAPSDVSEPTEDNPREAPACAGVAEAVSDMDSEDDHDADWWKARNVGKAQKPKRITERPRASLIVTNTTELGIVKLAEMNGGRAGIFAAEGAAFTRLLGGSRSYASLSTFLSGWSAEDVVIQRANGLSTRLEKPEIVFSVLAQPTIVELLLTHPASVGQGFAARFLVSAPPPRTGSYLDVHEIPLHLQFTWESRLDALLQRASHAAGKQGDLRRRVKVSQGALAALAKFHDSTQIRIDQIEDPLLTTWLGKAHGQVVRIAGLYSLLANVDAGEISVDEMDSAIRAVCYFEGQLVALRTGVTTSEISMDATRALEFLRTQSKSSISQSKVSQALRRGGRAFARDWEPVFELLEERGWIRRDKQGNSEGGRPSRTLQLHPSLRK